jgi:homocysteine S-methyltransferase
MIVDGGLGVELLDRGFACTTNLWSGEAILTRPDLLLEVHRAYLTAGAQVIATATYQVSHAELRRLGYSDAAIDGVFARAVGLVREAIAAHRLAGGAPAGEFVAAASLGPYGATVGDGSEYAATQHLEPAALAAFHIERLRSVVRAAPDVILFETVPTLAEAVIIAQAVRELGLRRVWMTFSCADGERTFGGDRVREIVAALGSYDGIEVLGVNCTAPGAVASLVREIQSQTAKPVLVCPNLGQRWETEGGGLAGGATAAEFLRHVPEWVALGVAHLGGCCGVGPRTIAELAAIVERERSRTV